MRLIKVFFIVSICMSFLVFSALEHDKNETAMASTQKINQELSVVKEFNNWIAEVTPVKNQDGSWTYYLETSFEGLPEDAGIYLTGMKLGETPLKITTHEPFDSSKVFEMTHTTSQFVDKVNLEIDWTLTTEGDFLDYIELVDFTFTK